MNSKIKIFLSNISEIGKAISSSKYNLQKYSMSWDGLLRELGQQAQKHLDHERDEEFIKAFEEWQADDFQHPWTCGIDSKHKLMHSYNIDGSLGPLRCFKCGYKQEVTEDMKKLVLGEK